jgi:hypothetical protein
MQYYKLDGELAQLQTTILISEGMIPIILKIRSACNLGDANGF